MAEGEAAFSGSQFVAAVYRGLLGRDPDADGASHYARRLHRVPAEPERVIEDILGSDEGRAVVCRAMGRLGERMWAARAAQTEPAPPLFFLHIMKTGGTALAKALRGLVPGPLSITDLLLDQLVLLPRSLLETAQLITGHLTYEASESLLAGMPVCTVIREPVERTLSHYHHVRADPAVMAEDARFSLETFLDSPRWQSLARNYQARHLVHRIGISGAWARYSPTERFAQLGPPFPHHHPLPLQSLFDCTPLLDDDGVLTVKALHRLQSIEFVGITERLDDLFHTVARYLQVKPLSGVPRENVGFGRPQPADIPPSLIRRIREANSVDEALYEQARARATRR